MPDQLTVETINIDALLRAMAEAPDLAATYLKQEMGRSANRVRRRFIAQRMSGPPGITGGAWRRQKWHVRTKAEGRELVDLAALVDISRFLAIHETGGVITAHNKGADMLRLPIGERRGIAFRGVRFEREPGTGYLKGLIFIRRPGKAPLLAEKHADGSLTPRYVLKGRVTIKPRLGFRQTIQAEWPQEYPKLRDTLGRAMSVAIARRMKTLNQAVQTVVHR